LNQFESDANAAIIAAKSLLAEVDILRGLLSDRVQDSDLAVEAARRERARCVAMANERRGQEEEWAKNNHAEWARMSSWIKPKLAHKAMVSKLLQVRAHVILCFRAEAKIDMVKDSNGKTVIVPKEGPGGFRGWLPITEKNLPYELTASFLFMAEAPGVPIPMKLQEQHRPFFPTDRVVTEEAGQRLAEWARGGSAPSQPIPAAATPIPNPTHPATAQQPAMGTAPATPKVLADFREAIEKLGFSEAKALAFSKWDQLEGHTRPELTALYASLKAAATPQEVSL
jgi:hypothetical protein